MMKKIIDITFCIKLPSGVNTSSVFIVADLTSYWAVNEHVEKAEACKKLEGESSGVEDNADEMTALEDDFHDNITTKALT